MASIKRIGVALAAAAGLLQPQTAETERTAFEVASIKPSGPHSIRGSQGGPGSSDPGRYRFNSASLLDLIALSYEVESFQISSPVPLDRQTFDLIAKVPGGATKQQFNAMLGNLLAQRFHLKLHVEQKDFPAYEMVVAKRGPKLKESAVGSLGTGDRPQAEAGWPELPPDRPSIATRNSISGGFVLVRMKAQEEPLSALVRFLQPADNLPVVDKTGLSGKYDFSLEYTKDLPNGGPDRPADAPPAPGLFTALQQQLGLQLVRKKVSFNILIVDSVDKLPTEN